MLYKSILHNQKNKIKILFCTFLYIINGCLGLKAGNNRMECALIKMVETIEWIPRTGLFQFSSVQVGQKFNSISVTKSNLRTSILVVRLRLFENSRIRFGRNAHPTVNFIDQFCQKIAD